MTSTVFLHVCTTDIDETQVRSVAGAAEAFNAHLDVVVVGEAALPPVGAHVESVYAPWMKERMEQQDEIKKKVCQLEEIFEELGTPCVVTGIHTEVFRIDDEVGNLARLSDIVLLGADLLGNQDVLGAVLDGAWFHADVPVLLDPRSSWEFKKPTVMIAWSDTAESASAVRTSLPLLSLAKAVHVVLVDHEGDRDDPAPRLLSYLSRHGIDNVSTEVLPAIVIRFPKPWRHIAEASKRTSS